MPSKKKKYNARFPAGRIKKIMQSDEEIGKVAQAVPVIISRTLELFVESLLRKTLQITNSRNAKTLSTSHMKQCIMSENRFDFLRELVKNIPDINVAEEAATYNDEEGQSSPEQSLAGDSDVPYDLSLPSTSRISTATGEEKDSYMLRSRDCGKANNYNQMTRELDVIHRLQQRVPSTSMGNSHNSVIKYKHITTMNTNPITEDSLPQKLSRSDSTPIQPQCRSTDFPLRKPLKHKSQSVPASDACVPVKLGKRDDTQFIPTHSKLPPAPAPIVNFDFCSKPVVKIDYSNLPIMSHPEISRSGRNNVDINDDITKSTFDFNTAPIINIDLSNIVPKNKIGNGPEPSEVIGKAASTLLKPNVPLTQMKPEISPNTFSTTTKKNLFIELDEDYDNI